MVSSRTRSVLLLERNVAIRELLGKRGRAAWVRRIVDAVYRAWKVARYGGDLGEI